MVSFSLTWAFNVLHNFYVTVTKRQKDLMQSHHLRVGHTCMCVLYQTESNYNCCIIFKALTCLMRKSQPKIDTRVIDIFFIICAVCKMCAVYLTEHKPNFKYNVVNILISRLKKSSESALNRE